MPSSRREWLAKASDDQVNDAYELGLKQVATYDAMLSRADAKGTGLLSVVGFCMTLAMSFGGWALLDNTRKVPFGGGLAAVFFLALCTGMVTGAYAVRVLRVRLLGTVDEDQVFADELKGLEKRDYRSVLTLHVWSVAERLFEANETKTTLLAIGQSWFVSFLGGLLLLSLMTVISAIKREPDLPPTPPSMTCPTCPAPTVNLACPPVVVVQDAGLRQDASHGVQQARP